MHHRKPAIAAAVLIVAWVGAEIQAKVTNGLYKPQQKGAVPVLWRDPGDISSRDLFYGPGGKAHEPHGPFTFQEEDMTGSTPKFDVVDRDGVRWRVKMAEEARPETAATRLMWAVGYFANEDYFVPSLHVEQMKKLRRGRNLVSATGDVRDARLKRHVKDEKKVGYWAWAKNPFTGTREWYGLRVMMAVLNNWDLKDNNNSVYLTHGDNPEERYLVSDLGCSFGPSGINWMLKGKPGEYCKSKLIKSETPESVTFYCPAGPAEQYFIHFPVLARTIGMLWIGENIPRAHAVWIGGLLGKLSPKQIQDAFRAAGYSPDEVEALSTTLTHRIAELQKL
jgi:hypothetical protein